MLVKNPYEIKTLKLINTTQTIANINKYIATDYAYITQKEKIKIKPFKDNYITLNPVILYGLSDIEKDIPIFNHPLISIENKWIALDLRQIVNPKKESIDYEIRNENEFNLAMQRFILSGIFYIGKESNLYALSFPHFIFANWLSDNLTKRFGLDLSNNVQLKILSLIYYSTLFTDKYTEDDLNKLIIRANKDIYIPELVKDTYKKIDKLETIDDFCRNCYNVTNNIRVKDLDFTVLINVVANNWYGLNSKELILAALEHPPTWISIVYAALTQKSFKKAYITNIVDKYNKRGAGDNFLKALIYTTKNYKEE